MSIRPFSVRVILTDECNDSLDEIIHGEGSSLGPTFDKIEKVAAKHNGSFEDWEPLCCDYSFPTREDAAKFIKSVKSKFKNQIALERVEKSDLETDELGMKKFKSLPDNFPERIAALTPKTISSYFSVKINVLHDNDCLVPDKSGGKLTYISMKCKVTGKIRSKMFYLQSASKAIKKFISDIQHNEEIQKAIKAGWTVSDIAYDAFINGVIPAQMESFYQDEKSYYDVFLSCNTIQVVVYDYLGEQYIGWFIYNDNLDEALSYTNYNV